MWKYSLRFYFAQFFVISTPTLIKSIPPLLHEIKLNMNFRTLLEFLEMYIFILFKFRFACATVVNF